MMKHETETVMLFDIGTSASKTMADICAKAKIFSVQIVRNMKKSQF